MDIIKKIQAVETMPELDGLRTEVAKIMCNPNGDVETFEAVQKAFIKAKNRLKRIPLSKRTW